MRQIVIVALGLLSLIGCIGGENTNDTIEQKREWGNLKVRELLCSITTPYHSSGEMC